MRTKLMTHNEISRIVVDTAINIHRRLGPGLLESDYLAVLAHELVQRGLSVKKEVPIPLVFATLRELLSWFRMPWCDDFSADRPRHATRQ
jgi:hypothetical protein